MTNNGLSWTARLLIALTLIIIGAGAATWGLAHSTAAARMLGVSPASPPATQPTATAAIAPPGDTDPLLAAPAPAPAAPDPRIGDLEQRVERVEHATQHAEGSAGRADALVIAFAARRAIDRGVALGYLEPLLLDRFGAQHAQAVATIITAARQPVRLTELIGDYDALGPQLRAGGPQDSWWTDARRQLGSMIDIHRADRPSTQPDARYQRAAAQLSAGEVDSTLAETMRLPGAARAGVWVAKARRYVAAHRALDDIESSALLVGAAPQ